MSALDFAGRLGGVYFLSELALRFTRRASGDTAKGFDRSSLAWLWVSVIVGVGIATSVAAAETHAAFHLGPIGRQAIVGIFVAGLVIRWWAIVTLGRFFTVNVAIASDHQLIQHGLYHYLRHPSYTGMMLAFVALGLSYHNWLSLVCLLVPISLALAWRIHVEEAALTSAFGDAYRQYQARTKRLVPWVY